MPSGKRISRRRVDIVFCQDTRREPSTPCSPSAPGASASWMIIYCGALCCFSNIREFDSPATVIAGLIFRKY